MRGSSGGGWRMSGSGWVRSRGGSGGSRRTFQWQHLQEQPLPQQQPQQPQQQQQLQQQLQWRQ